MNFRLRQYAIWHYMRKTDCYKTLTDIGIFSAADPIHHRGNAEAAVQRVHAASGLNFAAGDEVRLIGKQRGSRHPCHRTSTRLFGRYEGDHRDAEVTQPVLALL